MYDKYAQVFALSPGHREYNARLAEFLPGLLDRMDIQAQTVLDIACGVGDLGLGLARQGFTVTGVDLAPKMVEIARSRVADLSPGPSPTRGRGPDSPFLAREGGRGDRSDPAGSGGAGSAVFEVGDMRALPYTGQFDLVLCFGDSLNYMLTPNDVRKALRSMRQALVPGGWAIFDMLTLGAISTYYADQAYILQNSEDVFEAHENDYDPDTEIGTLTVTAFVRRADGTFDRVRETHYQRGYLPERIHRWAVGAGFEEPTWFTDWEIAEPMEDDDGEPTRVFCMCRAKHKPTD